MKSLECMACGAPVPVALNPRGEHIALPYCSDHMRRCVGVCAECRRLHHYRPTPAVDDRGLPIEVHPTRCGWCEEGR